MPQDVFRMFVGTDDRETHTFAESENGRVENIYSSTHNDGQLVSAVWEDQEGCQTLKKNTNQCRAEL